ncbi:MAG: hypothetical protein DRP22_03825 [Verrucomicrobia bacterium]|nr:MAG: hypothetical protein DRP22_03825 [Verrucomicrobiota bacterium]
MAVGISTGAALWCGASVMPDSPLAALQKRAWLYFDETTSTNGLPRDRLGDPALTSSGAAGYYLTALCIAEHNGWLTREEAARRALLCLDSFSRLARFHGFFAHYYDIGTGEVVPIVHEKDIGADTLQTALFLAGALTARVWFDGEDELEKRIQAIATRLYNEAEWDFMLQPAGPEGDDRLLVRYWSVPHGFAPLDMLTPDSHLEALLAYILAIGSPTHPIPAHYWYESWARRYRWLRYEGKDFISCPPLQAHVIPHLWLDLQYLRDRVADYWRNSRRAVLANRAFCLTHLYPERSIWGLGCCEGPKGYFCYGYPAARSVEEEAVLCPAAAVSAAMFLPGRAERIVRAWSRETPVSFRGPYGFFDGISLKSGWQSEEVSAENLGLLLAAIENIRSGTIRKAFMRNRCVRAALEQIGFTGMLADFNDPDSPYASYVPRAALIGFVSSGVRGGGRAMRILPSPEGERALGVDIYPRLHDFAPFSYLSLFIKPAAAPRVVLVDRCGEEESLEMVSRVTVSGTQWHRCYFDLGRVHRADLRHIRGLHLSWKFTNAPPREILLDEVTLTSRLDTEPPAPVAVSGVKPTRMPGEVVLSWTRSGDNGEEGTCFRYLVRYSRRPARTLADFLAAPDAGPRDPHDWIGGSITNWHVVGLRPGERYFFTVCAEDVAGNLSPLVPSSSAVAAGKHQPDTFLVDDFEWSEPVEDRPRWLSDSENVQIATTTTDALKGRRCLRISLPQTTSAVAMAEARLDVNDLSRYRWISVWARGRAKVGVSLVDRKGTLLECGKAEVIREDGWSPLSFRIPESPTFDYQRVASLLLSIRPLVESPTALYLDELLVSREKMP